ERTRAESVAVHKQPTGPQNGRSRTDPRPLVKLFETEVPEIYDGTVVIKAAVRAPGERAKVAVYSRERDVDPVGACVGMKGSRVQSIIRELRGEKIDIIEYSDDPVQYVTKALSPAKISRVTIMDPADNHMEVVVDDLQLSLAIGKRGQNVRLAAKLIGWKIDIKSEEEKRRELESRMGDMVISGAPVSVLMDHGLPEAILESLVAADIGTVERLGSMTPEQLEAIPEIDEATVARIQAAVMSFYGAYDTEPNEAAPVEPGEIEAAIDSETAKAGGESIERGRTPEEQNLSAFENIETGILEHDLATHEVPELDEIDEGQALDLGNVEGLSGAPSTLRDPVSEETGESPESDTMNRIE
ncbi:MAG: transcription termination/antitermination protein NusA, partial [Bryobacteraceae bacterium]